MIATRPGGRPGTPPEPAPEVIEPPTEILPVEESAPVSLSTKKLSRPTIASTSTPEEEADNAELFVDPMLSLLRTAKRIAAEDRHAVDTNAPEPTLMEELLRNNPSAAHPDGDTGSFEGFDSPGEPDAGFGFTDDDDDYEEKSRTDAAQVELDRQNMTIIAERDLGMLRAQKVRKRDALRLTLVLASLSVLTIIAGSGVEAVL